MFILLTSPDGKRRMLLNQEQVFAFVEEPNGSAHAVSVTGHTIEMPVDLDTIGATLDAVAESEGDDDGDD